MAVLGMVVSLSFLPRARQWGAAYMTQQGDAFELVGRPYLILKWAVNPWL